MSRPTSWFAGMALIGLAVVLFILVALSLSFLLVTSRTQFAAAQHTQMVMMQVVRVQDGLHDSLSAIRRDAGLHRRIDRAWLSQENRSTRANLARLSSLVQNDPSAVRQTSTISRSIEACLAAFERMTVTPSGGGSSILVERANAQLTGLRDAKHDELTRGLNDAHDNIRASIGLALFGAAGAPALGLLGLWLLNRARVAQRVRQMQSEMMHIQRLAVMGETAAVLAHDVSHPLTAANNYLGALRRMASTTSFAESEKIVELAGRAAKQITRASEILQRLRRFIEKRENERERAEPGVLIEDALALIGPVDSGVEFKTEIEAGLPSLLVDRVQIQQVMVNLMRNGLEAMQGCPQRQIIISAASEASAVIFSIADTGRGLPEKMAGLLFQPFVTSKREGMGIGLTICRNIIADHRGAIWAEPNAPAGTIFRFRLPATPAT